MSSKPPWHSFISFAFALPKVINRKALKLQFPGYFTRASVAVEIIHMEIVRNLDPSFPNHIWYVCSVLMITCYSHSLAFYVHDMCEWSHFFDDFQTLEYDPKYELGYYCPSDILELHLDGAQVYRAICRDSEGKELESLTLPFTILSQMRNCKT